MEAAAPARRGGGSTSGGSVSSSGGGGAGGGGGDGVVASGGRAKRRRGGKRKRGAGGDGSSARPLAVSDGSEDAPAEQQQEEQKPPAQWGCPACTFLNDAARRFCEMCATPNPTKPSAGPSVEMREWSCPTCTLMNPPRARVCVMCGSLNPEPATSGIMSLLQRRPAVGRGSSSSDGEESVDDEDSERGSWECSICDDDEQLSLSVKNCPNCSAPQPRAALLARTRAKDEHKPKRRKKSRDGEAKSAYGVSSGALRKLLKSAHHTSKLTDALQSLTHTLAMMDASAESEWGGIGGGALFMRGSSSIFSRPAQKDPELLAVLVQVFQQKEQQYPRATRLLAVQSINYLVKIERDFVARTAINKVSRMYITALKRWPTESQELEGQAEARDAQMIIEECVNGLSDMCNNEPSAVRELSTAVQFKGFLRFLEALFSTEETTSGNIHASVQLSALEILQRCCVKMRWERSNTSSSKHDQESAARADRNDNAINLDTAQSLISVLRKAIAHKHKQLHAKAAKCLLLIFNRAPRDEPSVIQELVPTELLREFIDIVVDSTTDESEESRLAVISLLVNLFDTRQNLVSLFLQDRIYEAFFKGLEQLLSSSSSLVSKRALKLGNLLTRAICQRHTVANHERKQPTDDSHRRMRSNSLPDPNVVITILLDFIEANSIPAVNAVLKDGADLNFPVIFDVHGREIEKPLHVAVEHASMGMIRFLVKRGADIHLDGPQGTALHIAARAGRCDVVLFLLKCGAKMDAKDRSGKTVVETVDQMQASGPSIPVKKLLEAYKKVHTHGDDSDESETDAFPGRSWRVSSRGGFTFDDECEDDDDDEEDDDDVDDEDDEDMEDMEEEDEDNDMYYEGYDDDDGDMYDRDHVGDEVDGKDYYSDEDRSDANSDGEHEDVQKGSSLSEHRRPSGVGTEMANASDNSDAQRGMTSKLESDDSVATRDQADAYTASILHCLLAALHSIDLQNVDRSVLSSLANVLEMSSSRPIRELKDEDIVLLLDTVHYLLQAEINMPAKTNVQTKPSSSTKLPTDDNSLSAKQKAGLASHILALRIMLAVARKSDTSSPIFYQIERRGIGEQIEELNRSSSQWISAPSDVKGDRAVRDTIFTRGAALLRSLRAEMMESGMLHLHRLKNLARRLKGIAADASHQEKEIAVVDFVELFEHANSITPYEFKQSMLLPAVLSYLTPDGTFEEDRMQSLTRALKGVPGALNNFIARLQSIINQEEAFPVLSFCSTKGGELYPLTRPLKLSFKRSKPHGSEESVSIHRSACVIQTSPLTHFQSLERSIFRALPVHDSKLTQFYTSLVGYKVQKIVDGKWRKFQVVGYDTSRSYHLLKPDASTSDKDFVEMVLHDTQCRLLGPVEVYDRASLDPKLFGTLADGPESTALKSSRKRKKASKKKRKQSSNAYEEVQGVLVEVKNSSFPSLGSLKNAWYAGVLQLPPSELGKSFEEVVTAGNSYTVVMSGSGKTIRKVAVERIRPRSKEPQIGSVVEVDGDLGEVTRVYEDDSPKSMPLWDVRLNSDIEKVRVSKERGRYPPPKRNTEEDSFIEAMSIRRLFPGKESSAAVGRVGDRVWVLPPADSAVKNIGVAGVVKRFPSGLESIRESTSVVIEISFGEDQAPVAVKVAQDRVLNFALGGLTGGNPARLLAALQSHGRGGGAAISDANRGISLREAFERIAGGGNFQSMSTASGLDSTASSLHTMLSGQSSRQSMTSSADSSTSNAAIDADSAATSRVNSPTEASTKRAAKSYQDEEVLKLVNHDGSGTPWTCTSFPKVKMQIGLRRCRSTESSSKSSAAMRPISSTDNRDDESKTELPGPVAQLMEIDSSTQEWVVKPQIRSLLIDVFNQFDPTSTASALPRRKKRKIQQLPEPHAPTKVSGLWNVDKFISLMRAVFEPSKRTGSSQSSTAIKYCVLFSKYATQESSRTLLSSDGFVGVLVTVCRDEMKAIQMLKYLRSRGFNKKLSRPLGDNNEKKHSTKSDDGSSSPNSEVMRDEEKKTSAPVLHNFLPDDNLLKCLEILREASGSGYRDIIARGEAEAVVPPWKLAFDLSCDFAVEWNGSSRLSGMMSTLRTDGNIAAKRDDISWIQDLKSPVRSLYEQSSQSTVSESVIESIRLLRYLFEFRPSEGTGIIDESLWANPRLCNKLEAQLQDVLSLCSGIYPKWCDEIIVNCKFFFPRRLREHLFRATSFGCTRSLHWFRARLALDESGGDLGGSGARDYGGVYNQDITISPIPKDRVKVHRANILSSAETVMKMHAKRKAILDVVFVGEKGYGSGVTAAFYSATAHALQSVSENRQVSTRCWVPGDEDYDAVEDDTDLELDAEAAPVIRHSNGLFPYPHGKVPSKVIDRFRMMGRLAGKALMDERLLPLPLSKQFIQLVVGETVPVESIPDVFGSHGRVIYSMFEASRKLKSAADRSSVMIDGIGIADWLEAVDLSFIEPFSQEPLMSGGETKAVTVSNMGEYVALVLDKWLSSGVAAQVVAFREGISEVLPLEKLRLMFVPELLEMLCGDDDVKWDADSLLRSMKLAHGYTRESQPIQFFVRALERMSSLERRAFLLYATGCPNLPPGGIAALKPQFEVVRRVVDSGVEVDRALPFARTCSNTLHLPAYSSQQVLDAQLAFAVANSRGVIDRD